MHNEMLDILSGKKSAVTSEQLLNYLHGNLPDNEKHELEKILLNNGIESEALEGLQMVASQEKLKQYEFEINKALREKLQQKKTRRKPKLPLQLNHLIMLTGALLALVILVWILLHLMQTG